MDLTSTESTDVSTIGSIKRFPTVKDFVSYSRLVAGTNESGGKDFGGKGRKMGNPYLK